ncbi:L-2-hydroxyglutarate oxidase [Neorhodopirellula lusitana]|uniref:L-2-hydroxyglutarate oxidase n=1 Tax=Neorhodopirellula lusitana TaxID=445327 RepID=A0ABY1PQF6_9BACT|nr:L-2-hydroxyglutarate oxidase [Neorhodopirellula lusitana]SMP38252.1 L-2-hydroxyglutarate oxidase [Neorhodopirellula lusitana]
MKQPARIVIGGGIVGLATALQWVQSQPGLPLTVIEAEPELARHQSGHNSGVIHSGIYYRPGSEKARLCIEGKTLMEAFCKKHGIRTEKCGKVIVATSSSELSELEKLVQRGQENGVPLRRIHTDELRRLEPDVAGLAAIHVPSTGIVDYRQVCSALRDQIQQLGGTVRLSKRVDRIDYDDHSVRIGIADGSEFQATEAIVCAGLHSDRLYQLASCSALGTDKPRHDGIRIIPFRGEYYELVPERRSLVRNLIYPVPDPRYPFLGVHFTRMIGSAGSGHDPVECGPNAVLALSRHGYTWSDLNRSDLMETLRFSGFHRLAWNHWRMGLGEIHRSLRKSVFVKSLQRLIPAIRTEDLVRARSGVRAQAVAEDGSMVDDFLFRQTPRMTHVLNAPSPAATASLAIAKRIVQLHTAQ